MEYAPIGPASQVPYFFDQTLWLLFFLLQVLVKLLFEGGIYLFVRVVAITATICGTRTHMRIISDNSHWASTRTFCVGKTAYINNRLDKVHTSNTITTKKFDRIISAKTKKGEPS